MLSNVKEALLATRKLFSNYGMTIKFNDIKQLDVLIMNREIYKLKSQKKIDNKEYTLLQEIKNIIKEINLYELDHQYDTLINTINSTIEYSKNKSTKKDNNLFKQLQLLSASSKESITNAEIFNDFNKYMHVKRNIEEVLIDTLEKLKNQQKNIIFLVGSVGDGKSHLLSYIRHTNPELFESYEIYNDATESDSPHRTAVETLTSKLYKYKFATDKKLIIAINIGMLYNLVTYLKEQDTLLEIVQFINGSNVMGDKGLDESSYIEENLAIVSFLNESSYEIKESKIHSRFYDQIFKKIFSKDNENPFYRAYIIDEGENRKEAIYTNYRLLLNEEIQKAISFLLVKVQIANKRILTTRSVLNFIYDIVVPEENIKNNDKFLPSLLFNNEEKSQLLKSMAKQDPLLIQNTELDRLNLEIYNALDFNRKCLEIFGEDKMFELKDIIDLIRGLQHSRKFEMIIRLDYLFNYKKYEENTFLEFIDVYDNVEKHNEYKKKLLNQINMIIAAWNGSPKENYIYNDSINSDTKMMIALNYRTKFKGVKANKDLTLTVTLQINDKPYELTIDYSLYALLEKVENGYILKEKDKTEMVVIASFVEEVLNNLKSLETTIINLPLSNETYILKESDFGYEIGRV